MCVCRNITNKKDELEVVIRHCLFCHEKVAHLHSTVIKTYVENSAPASVNMS